MTRARLYLETAVSLVVLSSAAVLSLYGLALLIRGAAELLRAVLE